ncbi:aldehyde dehydrogenase domain-containing protein [Sporodiniella umbellata]|nr:aldehyde dehydrogenase domain-containing protein [Sporodiniella umbellata]
MSEFLIKINTSKNYQLELQTGLFINNKFVKGSDTIEVLYPSTGKVITCVQAAEEKDVDRAVDAAEKAFHGEWSSIASTERSKLLRRFADLMERDFEEISQIETLNSGKAIASARSFDISLCIKTLRYYSGLADKINGKVIDTEGCLSYTRHEPLGVCGAIVPWNFPLLLLMWKIGPTLTTGNTVVVKTSEITPLSALKIASLIVEAGFPPGVVNILTGYGSKAGHALAKHMKVAKISFTGSTFTGRSIMKAAAESNLKRVTLELGGKCPIIVFDDADLEQTVKWAYNGSFFNQGQVCCAGSRIYVQETVYDQFLEKFKERSYVKRIGDPEDEDTFQGPQISKKHCDTIMEYIESAKKDGATCYMGGNRWGNEGYYIEPTVFTDVHQKMKIVQEEIFGPVVTISKFKDVEDVIKMALDTNYGLAAAVFTQNTARALNVSNRLQSGTVWINCYNEIDCNTPFGGYRQSGFGRENGEYALDEYVQIKTVKINVSRLP